MAGICGIITREQDLTIKNKLERMLQSLVIDEIQHVTTLFLDHAAIAAVGRINQPADEVYSTYQEYCIFVQGHFYFSKEQQDWLEHTKGRRCTQLL